MDNDSMGSLVYTGDFPEKRSECIASLQLQYSMETE
jgi:hypothetical protein